MSEPLVRNAADESQVNAARTREKLVQQREISDICVLLAMPEGRRLLWRFLEKAGVFKTIWESSARIHYNAGQQDFGHYIMALIVKADPNAFLKMMVENKAEEELPPQKEK